MHILSAKREFINLKISTRFPPNQTTKGEFLTHPRPLGVKQIGIRVHRHPEHWFTERKAVTATKVFAPENSTLRRSAPSPSSSRTDRNRATNRPRIFRSLYNKRASVFRGARKPAVLKRGPPVAVGGAKRGRFAIRPWGRIDMFGR